MVDQSHYCHVTAVSLISQYRLSMWSAELYDTLITPDN